MAAKVHSVDHGSLACEAGIQPEDVILSINGTEIHDYLDYMFASCREEVKIQLDDRTVTIHNEDFMPLGIGFNTLLIDEPRSCHNRCVFCFIDQLPQGMRKTCYFKDDDYRLSFLQGNYVSMTNMKQEDVDRILRYHLPRINVSVHTTNPELRQRMLHNKRAGEVLDYLKQLADGGVNLNAQIVLCPGLNDGDELDRTLKDLGSLGSRIESISIVPVGLSDHRQGLTELKGFDKDSASAVIAQVEQWQKKFLEILGTHLVYLGDEFYLMAEEKLPDYDEYEEFPQIENGVGLCSALSYEFYEALRDTHKRRPKRRKTVVTGKSALPLMEELVGELKGDKVQVIAVENRFFGENITVAGLLCGQDLIAQLKERELGEELLISSSMLRRDEEVFLDNVTVSQVAEALGVRVRPIPNDGYLFLAALLD